jgi:predicted nucleic acid-binding protein
MICLDNSVLSRFSSPESFPEIEEYLAAHSSALWTVPASVAYEYYSYFDSQSEIRTQQRRLEETLDGILPVDDSVAAEAAMIETALTQQDTSLDTADLIHVATARESGATFVTRDRDDFDREPIQQLLDVDIL